MQERIQKRVWNIHCVSQVLLKSTAVFLGNQGLRAHNLRSLETQIPRQRPSGKKVLLNLACGRRPILTLRSLSQSTAIVPHTWTFESRRIWSHNSRWHIAVCSMKFYNTVGCNDVLGWFNGSLTEFNNADIKTVITYHKYATKLTLDALPFHVS